MSGHHIKNANLDLELIASSPISNRLNIIGGVKTPKVKQVVSNRAAGQHKVDI
jgi:hypothetical protein